MTTQISEEIWKKACANMAQASNETVETFGCMLQNIIFDPIKRPVEYSEKLASIVNYVASEKFREEEGL
jgi:hypothetical protein